MAASANQTPRLVGHAAARSGMDFGAAAREVFHQAVSMAGLAEEQVAAVLSTGYGRHNVGFAKLTRTEIACHGRGAFFHFPEAITVIDVGAQDNKIIRLDGQGRRVDFKMNRKCAAGTGAFLEEMALRLGLGLDEFRRLAAQGDEVIELGAFCTVFSATEVLEKIRSGKSPAGIARGVYLSMIRRVLEMDEPTGRVVLTGGVAAHNPVFVSMFARTLGREVSLPPLAQLAGALGAALLAWESTRT